MAKERAWKTLAVLGRRVFLNDDILPLIVGCVIGLGAVALRRGVIRMREVLAKAIASALSIGSVGSVGREGPIVQIGSALGSSLGQALRAPDFHMKTLVSCGAAAGNLGNLQCAVCRSEPGDFRTSARSKHSPQKKTDRMLRSGKRREASPKNGEIRTKVP